MKTCLVETCKSLSHAKNYCGAHYMKLKRHGDPNITKQVRFKGTTEERFLSRITKLGADECWPWTGTLDNNGYGLFSVKHKYVGAHRYSYQLSVGPIEPGLVVDHTCHNRDPDCRAVADCLHRRCVNPRHLEPVTRGENAQRGKFRIPTCAKGHPRSMFTKQNECGECARQRARRRYHANKAVAA